MIKGIRTSEHAMRYGILRQELTAGNLANVSTTGYKRDRAFATELIHASADESGDNSPIGSTGRWTDFAPGAFNPTGADLDLAIQSRGFFVLSDGSGEVFTRGGHFTRNSEGLLVDSQGRTVQGEGGTISVPPGRITISSNGVISVDGTVVDRLRIVQFENPQSLTKAAGSAFRKSSQTIPENPVENPVVLQGFLEGSNVDAVREMVEMISTARNYEINAKALNAQDESLRHTVNEIGRV